MTHRLAMVLPRFPRLSETFIVSKFLGLLDRGWDVHVVCRDYDREELAHFPVLKDPSVQSRIHVSWPTSSNWRAAVSAPLAAVQLGRAIGRAGVQELVKHRSTLGDSPLRTAYTHARLLELRPALIHFEFGSSAPRAIAIKDVIGARAVVSFRGHDISFVGLDDPAYYGEVWERADAIHCLGEDLWRRAVARGCAPDTLHRLISPAIDVDRFTDIAPREGGAVGTPERPLRLLSVARIYWTKGHEYSLAVVRALRARGLHVEMRLVGGGEADEATGFARHQLGVEREVSLLGPRSPQEIHEHLQWADAFVHLSVSEGFCNAVIEAQAAAVPVVCSDADGLPANIVDGVTGYIVPRRNVELPVERLIELAHDGALRQRLGRAGRARAMSEFRIDDQVTAFDELYREVLQRDAR